MTSRDPEIVSMKKRTENRDNMTQESLMIEKLRICEHNVCGHVMCSGTVLLGNSYHCRPDRM